jgi:hypothetical protein
MILRKNKINNKNDTRNNNDGEQCAADGGGLAPGTGVESLHHIQGNIQGTLTILFGPQLLSFLDRFQFAPRRS